MSLESNTKAIKKYLDKHGVDCETASSRPDVLFTKFREHGINSTPIKFTIWLSWDHVIRVKTVDLYTASNLEEKQALLYHVFERMSTYMLGLSVETTKFNSREKTKSELIDELKNIESTSSEYLHTLWDKDLAIDCDIFIPIMGETVSQEMLDRKLTPFFHKVFYFREDLAIKAEKIKQNADQMDMLTKDMWTEERDIEKDANTFMEQIRGLVSSAMK